ncbi:hypothetical protein B0H13DRAFT_2241526 [Mycena leptocephala]|nr:hypothetical protein B0H13DRAFT_2241526 [Mycena leptocephala]
MSESQANPQSVLAPAELAFLKTQTGIQDDEELKAHVLAIQKKAYEICMGLNCVYPYACIRLFGFVNRAAHEHVLDLGRSVSRALILDTGCGGAYFLSSMYIYKITAMFLEVGNDLRKIADDGFPVQNIIEFWDLGHELFRSTTILFPATLVAGDAFDLTFLSLPPLTEEPQPATSHLDLRTLMSLNELHGRLSAEQQLELARKLAGLLSARPGSIIFGSHGAKLTKGDSSSWGDNGIFHPSPESWARLQTELKNVGKVLGSTSDLHVMFWSIKRV